jgi:REP element-mobilizing transposase RayT
VGRWGNLAGMARPLRIEVDGGWYHVTGRGNERRALFRDERDRKLAGRMAEVEDRLSK